MKKILIFTDSRGEHKETFMNKKIFPEKLRDHFQGKYEFDLMCCPFGSTTTFDFFECIDKKFIDPKTYYKIILYTGIVEHSPRPYSTINTLYNNSSNIKITKKLLLRPIMKKGRIVKSKKYIIDKIIGENEMQDHIKNPYDIIYKNEKTISLISKDMLINKLIQELKNYDDKLIFINSNKIVHGWEGNYLKVNPNGRPKNIFIIEEYSKILFDNLSTVVNLLEWSYEEVKIYTVDNMHLSYKGSEWIFDRLRNILE